MKVFVTGANGFIGSNFIKQNKHDFDLACGVRSKVNHIDVCRQHILDLGDPTGWNEALQGCDVVLHMAAIAHTKDADSNKMYAVNVQGTEMLAKACIKANVKRFVFLSSIGVHGQLHNGAIDEESEIRPHDSYTHSKYEAELKLQDVFKGHEVELVIVRPSLVYGIAASGSFGLLRKAVLGIGITPFGLVKNKKQFIALSNLISLLKKCIVQPNIGGQVFVCADKDSMSLKCIAKHIAEASSKSLIQLPVPVVLLKLLLSLVGKKKLAEQLFENFEVDISRAQKQLSWEPTHSMHAELKNRKG